MFAVSLILIFRKSLFLSLQRYTVEWSLYYLDDDSCQSLGLALHLGQVGSNVLICRFNPVGRTRRSAGAGIV